MILIREIVQNAFATGCLTVEAEEQLRQLLRQKYDAKDLTAFMSLQQAAMSGAILQESRERALHDRTRSNWAVSHCATFHSPPSRCVVTDRAIAPRIMA